VPAVTLGFCHITVLYRERAHGERERNRNERGSYPDEEWVCSQTLHEKAIMAENGGSE
jgi:hypothetical protein